jgi:hypothetical protein
MNLTLVFVGVTILCDLAATLHWMNTPELSTGDILLIAFLYVLALLHMGLAVVSHQLGKELDNLSRGLTNWAAHRLR